MITRRQAIQAAAGLGTIVGGVALAQSPSRPATPDFKVQRGRIRQSVMGWCFNPMKPEELAKYCKEIGLVAIEGIPRESYPAVKALGLEISLVGSHGFARGPCNPLFQEETEAKLTEAINVAVAVGCKRVITFTGMKFEGMDPEQGAKNCIATWKKVLPHAEKQKITLCLEHLNSRDNTHPMKGHPGYFGDNVDFCIDLVKQIGSPNFKLLFDIYHRPVKLARTASSPSPFRTAGRRCVNGLRVLLITTPRHICSSNLLPSQNKGTSPAASLLNLGSAKS